MTLTKTLPKAWKAYAKNKRYLILAVLFEFIFLFVITQIHLSLFIPSADAAIQVGQIMGVQMESLSEADMYKLETVLADNPEFMQAYRNLLTYIVIFILAMLAAWIIFKLPVWYLSHKTIHKKIPFGTYALKFSLLSLFWFVALCIVFSIYSMAMGSPATILPLVSSTGASLFMLLLFAVILYFSQVSFALIPSQQTFKKTFTLGVKHAGTILPAFLVNALIAFIVLTLPFNWIQTMPLLAMAIIIFISIPALAFTRIHMIVASWEK